MPEAKYSLTLGHEWSSIPSGSFTIPWSSDKKVPNNVTREHGRPAEISWLLEGKVGLKGAQSPYFDTYTHRPLKLEIGYQQILLP